MDSNNPVNPPPQQDIKTPLEPINGPSIQQLENAQPSQPPLQQPVTTPPVQPVQQTPVNPLLNNPPKGNGLKKILVALIVVVIAGGLAAGGYLYLNSSKKTYNATVYNPPVLKTPTPQPTSAPTINPNDSSNQALSSDSQILNQDLNSVSSDMNNVDQSFSDQQTNLQ